MTRPGIESLSPGPLMNTLLIKPIFSRIFVQKLLSVEKYNTGCKFLFPIGFKWRMKIFVRIICLVKSFLLFFCLLNSQCFHGNLVFGSFYGRSFSLFISLFVWIIIENYLSKFLKWSWMIFTTQSIQTIVFIFIVISTMFLLMRSLAGVSCWTKLPTQNFEPNTLFNPQG